MSSASATAVEWAAFLPAALVVAATPGANQLLSLRNGVRHGWAAAVTASAGRFAAFALMVVAVAAGLGSVLVASETAFETIKWCGVAYLVWLGARSLLSAGRALPLPEETRGAGASGLRLARQEFTVAASNPKALILFTVFLPRFVTPGAGGAVLPLLALGGAYIGVESVCACGYAFVGGRLRRLGITRRLRRVLDAVTGGAMLGLAGFLAVEER
ncbi:LysE family translocator [Streptomyces tsukubensis]|uniref:Homoserine transporter n=1 Tax=Streptomyces tsukubensis TaxID=83656 RepID=A0A1V4A4U3_9ACTN|nr:LysE family translocator [Streptomyces tsukubensis]OON75355.1 homoserine transporter [Streptomyces tsukubensis]QFR95014.1 LysE family translocator [Streptomyces tsukubensis]